MRLTKTDRYGHFYTNEANCRNVYSEDGKTLKGEYGINHTLTIDGRAIDKLGKLEDIEEELGIDLITFSKLLYALDKDCVFVKVRKTKQYSGYSVNEETGEIERRLIARFSRYFNGTRDWFFSICFNSISSVNHYLLKDYGKTWALTKEELKNE